MKAIAILILASLPTPHVQISQLSPKAQPNADFAQPAPATASHKGGQWYFARTGHAVYCYGPVMTVSNPSGDVERVATFCKGDRLLVPLKD